MFVSYPNAARPCSHEAHRDPRRAELRRFANVLHWRSVMRRSSGLVLMAGLFWLTAFVSMVKGPGVGEYHFKPDSVLVKRGDVVRFTNESNTIHNVQFFQVPEGADVGGYKRGPFLTAKGETYAIVIGKGFVPGTYIIVCAPHVSMYMSGRIIVQE